MLAEKFGFRSERHIFRMGSMCHGASSKILPTNHFWDFEITIKGILNPFVIFFFLFLHRLPRRSMHSSLYGTRKPGHKSVNWGRTHSPSHRWRSRTMVNIYCQYREIEGGHCFNRRTQVIKYLSMLFNDACLDWSHFL